MSKLKRDDTVVVLIGKDKDKKGKILKIFPAGKKAIVEKVNMQTRHLRPTQENPKGGKSSFEGLIDLATFITLFL